MFFAVFGDYIGFYPIAWLVLYPMSGVFFKKGIFPEFYCY